MQFTTGVKVFLYCLDSDQWKQTRATATSLRVMNTWCLRKQVRSPWQKCFPATLQWLCSPQNPHLWSAPPTSPLPASCQRLQGSSFQRISQHWLSYPALSSARKAPEGLHSCTGISAESYNKSFGFLCLGFLPILLMCFLSSTLVLELKDTYSK